MAMNKKDLADVLVQTVNMQKKDALVAVDTVFDAITKTLVKGDDVKIPGFGNFKVAKRAERMGVNPKTGEKIKIAASIKPKFRAAKALKEAVK